MQALRGSPQVPAEAAEALLSEVLQDAPLPRAPSPRLCPQTLRGQAHPAHAREPRVPPPPDRKAGATRRAPGPKPRPAGGPIPRRTAAHAQAAAPGLVLGRAPRSSRRAPVFPPRVEEERTRGDSHAGGVRRRRPSSGPAAPCPPRLSGPGAAQSGAHMRLRSVPVPRVPGTPHTRAHAPPAAPGQSRPRGSQDQNQRN